MLLRLLQWNIKYIYVGISFITNPFNYSKFNCTPGIQSTYLKMLQLSFSEEESDDNDAVLVLGLWLFNHLYICLSSKILDRTSSPKLLDRFTSNFQELILRIPIFACSSVVRLSVKIIDRTSPPKLLNGFTSNFQELILGVPISVCSSVVRLSVKILVRTSPPKLLDGFT